MRKNDLTDWLVAQRVDRGTGQTLSDLSPIRPISVSVLYTRKGGAGFCFPDGGSLLSAWRRLRLEPAKLMSQPFRYVLAVVAGVIAAFIVVWAIESVSHAVYPPPEGLDLTDRAALRTYVDGLPVGALLFVLIAWIVATFVGGVVSCFIARERTIVFAGIVGGVLLVASIVNMIAIPHPTWFLIAAIILIPAAAYAASRFATRSFGPITTERQDGVLGET